MVGNALATEMRCSPPTSASAMLNWMRSAAPLPLAVLLAAVMASRRLTLPSAPRSASKALIDDVSPSSTSLVVSTVMSACVLSITATFFANSELLLKVVKPALLRVAEALINSPTATATLWVLEKVALPEPSVVTLTKPR